MIITLLGLAFIIAAIIIFKVTEREIFDYIGAMCLFIGAATLVTCLILFLANHCLLDKDRELNNMEYENLTTQIEMAKSEYEDVSKLDVYSKVFEYNKKIYQYKFDAENPFTSWLFSKEFADELKYIEI